MADVFLSYAHNDEAKARQLKALLEQKKYSVSWDGDLVPGPGYPRQLQSSVTSARCVVVLWTPDSVRSTWVLEEATMGRDQGKLVPAKLRDVELPLGFTLPQTADLRGWSGDASHPGIQQLERGVRAHLEEPPPPVSPRRRLPLLGLLAPALLAASIVAVLALWPAPTTVDADVLTTRLRFHTSAESQQLFDAMRVRSLAVQGFKEMQLPQGAETTVTGHGASLDGTDRLVLRPSGADRARISIDPVNAGEALSIDSISARSAGVTVDVPEKGSIGVTVRGAQLGIGASLPAEVKMLATACTSTPQAWPADQPSVTLRSRVSPSNRLLNFSSTEEPLRLVLGLEPDRYQQVLKADLRADQFEFLQQAPSGVVESTIVTGVLRFPDLGRSQRLSRNDFLTLENARSFLIRQVDLRDEGALRVQLHGIAGSVSYGAGGYLKRERFTRLSTLAVHQLLIGFIAWLLPQWWVWRWYRRAV